MSSTTIKFDKESRVLAQFDRTLRNNARNPLPTMIEREMARNRPAVAKKETTRYSFHNPNNPLNGIKHKNRVEQIEILKAIKDAEKAARKKK
jgi:hypothetical protein